MKETGTLITHWDESKKNWLESRRSTNTRRSYEFALNELLETFQKSPEAITREDVRRYAQILKERGLKPATINARLGAISSFYVFAVEECKLMDHNPADMRSIRPRVTRYMESRALSTAECKKLLGQCEISTISGLRDFVLISGYLILGRRNTEWRSARTCDLEISGDGYFFRWAGKGKSDLVMVPDQLWALLSRYVAESGGRGIYDHIFLNRFGGLISGESVSRMVKQKAKEAGIGGRIRVHDLRHTAARLRREAGADVEEIREFLAHSSLAVTQVYLHRMERSTNKRAEDVCVNLLKNIVG
jgi:integrase